MRIQLISELNAARANYREHELQHAEALRQNDRPQADFHIKMIRLYAAEARQIEAEIN